jgi:lipopolysaccharide export system permease protein
MTRLAGYLVRLFSLDALALFGVAMFLLFLAQCLRTFDIVSAKGQDIFTLIIQTALSMPTLAIAFSFVCLGIGLGRGLRTLQQTQELHIIHSSRRLPALFGAIGTYILGSVVFVLLLTNVIEPIAKRYHTSRAAEIAADLVGRTLTPHRFIEIADGVTVVIGSRGASGELGSFFAHDTRNKAMSRTYRANSALLARDEAGYVLQLSDGVIEYLSDEGEFSEIAFSRHDLAVEGLTGTTEAGYGLDTVTTPELIARGMAEGQISREYWGQIVGRYGEGFRVLAICLLAAALAAFPHGKRNRRELPIEIVILGIAFLERLVSSVVGMPQFFPPSGTIVLTLLALVVVAFKVRPRSRRLPRSYRRKRRAVPA